MFLKTVTTILKIQDKEYEIIVPAIPTTPDHETIRKAGNILRKAADETIYHVKN